MAAAGADTEGPPMATERQVLRRGQAFYEMALGMLALALVVSSLCLFTRYIIRSLEMQQRLRAEVGCKAFHSIGAGDNESYVSSKEDDTIDIPVFAAEYIFGSDVLPVHEELHIPPMTGLIDPVRADPRN